MAYVFITISFDEEKQEFDDSKFKEIEKKYRIKSCQTAFFQTNKKAYWTAFIEYEGQVTSTEKLEKLSPEATKKYEGIRAWRNEKAEKEGIPPYIIATNRQLQQFAQIEDFTLIALSAIKGFGKAKAEKYGKDILNILNQTKAKDDN